MANFFNRRDALRIGLAAGTASLANGGRNIATGTEIPEPSESYPSAVNLTPYNHGGQVLLRWNNMVVGAYRANPIQKYPYFNDLLGPVSGIPLTTESSEPHPHHRGIWLGCEPLCGGDYWRDGLLEEGQIRSLNLTVVKKSDTCAEIQNRCQWIRRGAPSPLLDERRFTFTVLDRRMHLLDVEIRLTALQRIRIAKAKHSFFAIRVSPDLAPTGGGNLVNALGGTGESQTYGKNADWCCYYGRRAQRSDVVEGVAVMEHPANPWSPCPWFTRDYGHLSPSPFNFLKKPWELVEGSSLQLRYRVALHAGDPNEAQLDQVYKSWIT